MRVDVAIIGGGPAGSTAGSILKKYAPELKVAIFERERFPRDHVGESQLPIVSSILEEMGCWDKVEAAGFPVKIGVAYRWGNTDDIWNFEFLASGHFERQERPATFTGQRLNTAFHVDRALYDQLLLDHAAEMGCDVRQETKVVKVLRNGDRVATLELEDHSTVSADWFIDASGQSAAIRKAMGVEVESPTSLRNIALWNYWQDADWAEEIGIGGTRPWIMSIGYGWLWFIALSRTRTSVGLVVPAQYFKQSKKTPARLYAEGIAAEPVVSKLLANAAAEPRLRSTNDWSFVADRIVGENWFLVGDACGFADPILAAGMSLAQASAREAACVILESRRGEFESDWLKRSYDETHRARVKQHIRFADFWYTGNGCFTDLKQFTSEIAKDAGLEFDADEAFRWLGTGGFANDSSGIASVSTFTVGAIKQLTRIFHGQEAKWTLNRFNDFRLDLVGAKEEVVPLYGDGRVIPTRSYLRGGHRLVLIGAFKIAFGALQHSRSIQDIISHIVRAFPVPKGAPKDANVHYALDALEAMLSEGWVIGKIDKSKPMMQIMYTPEETPIVYFRTDTPRSTHA